MTRRLLSSDTRREINERFKRATSVDIEEDGISRSITLPGFKYDDYGREGRLCAHKIARVFDILKEHQPTGYTFLTLTSQIDFSLNIYNEPGIDYPITLTQTVTSLGEHSVVSESVMRHKETCKELARTKTVNVSTESESNAASKNKISGSRWQVGDKWQSIGSPLIMSSVKMPPERHFVHEVFVRYDDLDTDQRATTASYILYATECATVAFSQHFYRMSDNLQAGDELHLIKCIKILHTSESVVCGDTLTIWTWEDENDSHIVRFVMKASSVLTTDGHRKVGDSYTGFAEAGREVCQMEFEYFPAGAAESRSHL